MAKHKEKHHQKSVSKPNPFETKSPKPGRADANHNHETAATAKKKKNKLGPNAVAMKHQVPLKPNPFETIWSRRKFDILGKKRKGEERRVGLSRSRAIEKIALFYVAVLAGLLHRFPANFTQQTPGQIRNRKSGGSAGAKASEQGEAITFANVAGVDEAKAELEEIVEFLRNPDKYIRLGARPPRGFLLVECIIPKDDGSHLEKYYFSTQA